MDNFLARRLAFSVILLTMVFLLLAPVQTFIISDQNQKILSMPVPLGHGISTGYEHSVQLTPVEDDYRIVDSFLWLWEERVVSHNAGLPVEAPRNGSFSMDRDWMYIRGGRYHWPSFNLRVGDETLGKNWMKIGKSSVLLLHRLFPGKRLTLTVQEQPVVFSILNSQKHLLQKGD